MINEIKVNKGLSLTLLIFAVIGVIPFVSFFLHLLIVFPLINVIIAFIYLLKSNKSFCIIAYFVLSLVILILTLPTLGFIVDLLYQVGSNESIYVDGVVDQVAYNDLVNEILMKYSNNTFMVIGIYGSVVGKVVLLVFAIINNNNEKRKQQEILMRDVINQVNN